jgi:hypothetical protein
LDAALTFATAFFLHDSFRPSAMVNPWLLVPPVNFFDTGSLPFSSNAGIYCFDSALTLRDEIPEYFRHEPVSTAW